MKWSNISSRLVSLFSTPFQVAVVLMVGCAVYANSLQVPFQFDDLGITDKSLLWARAFSPSSRQLVDLTFVFNHQLHGDQPFGFHLVNIAVHLAAAVSLYGLVSAALAAVRTEFHPQQDDDRFLQQFLPVATALLFVCHPIQTQAVTYIVQRYTAMAALFYFCSVMTFIHARISARSGSPLSRTILYAVASLASAILAMRSKEIAYTLPLMFVIVEAMLFQGQLLKNRIFVGCILVTLLVIPLSRIIQIQGSGGLEDLLYNIKHGTREELTYSRGDYLLTQAGVVARYLGLLIVPTGLNLDYDIPLQKNLFSLQVLAPLALHLSLWTAAALLFRRSGRLLRAGECHQGTCLRLASLGIVWFYVTLLVESSIIPILDVMFEHRIYLPSGGGILAIVSGAAALAGYRDRARTILCCGVAFICCVFSIATVQRNHIWSSGLMLWEDTARKSPNKPRVLANLTAAYLDAQRPDKAIPLLVHTLELSPGMHDPLNNLGMALEQTWKYEGRFDNGQRFLLGGRMANPRYLTQWFANSRNNLGLAYEYLGRPADALKSYEAAVILLPTFELAWYNLYLVAVQLQDQHRAAVALQKLKELSPDRANAAIRNAAGLP